MLLLAWVFLGAVGFVCSLVAWTTDNNERAIIFGLAGAFTWLLFAFFALDVTHLDNSGNTYRTRYPAMAAWGLLMAVPDLFVALTGPLQIVGKQNEKLRQEMN